MSLPIPPGDTSSASPRVLRLLRRWGRRPIAAGIAVALVVTGSAVAVALAGEPDAPALETDAVVPAEVAAAPTTTTTIPPVDAAVAAYPTTPTPPPPERAPSPIVRIGEIRIPKIGLVHPIYEGVTLTVVDHGPGHWPGSAMPGQYGNVVFAGHRVTHSHPFRKIDQLVAGDEIILKTDAGEFTYQVTKQEIVSPKDTWIVNPTPDATLTIFACHPPGSARQRIVVRGVYVASNTTPASSAALASGVS